MNKDVYVKQVIAVLNSSLDSIGPDASRKLQSARERACSLAAQQSQSHQLRSAHSLAWSDWMRQHRTGLVGMLLVIVLCATAAIWQTSFSSDDDTAAIDTELLTGDLPVNAYLDGHLSKWVTNSTD
ncbi:hypothetical protein CAP31_06420 [Sulfuriferula sp. AH1]|uniref:DUF3619 family protein n=1 Tax=Sulfuriferula sp. AH1 TaxID=1985873 RepID=UPI000B3BA71A|nr:DUF3619 family protein [Sulfuriferula sp. AH1]ARU31351.1 hypothetical protein CAP31_06420 [Sulfuriferula sp. AH1]